MGVVPSYFEREGPVSTSQSGRFTQIQPPKPLPQNMAANVSREVVNESSMGTDEIRRFSNALAVTQELINKSAFILERQGKLESELETCHERYEMQIQGHPTRI